MRPEDLDDEFEAEEWDEETLGLDWSEADARNVLREVVPLADVSD